MRKRGEEQGIRTKKIKKIKKMEYKKTKKGEEERVRAGLEERRAKRKTTKKETIMRKI